MSAKIRYKAVARFTNGFGNNVFQYAFSRLFAEQHGMEMCVDHSIAPAYSIDTFGELGISLTHHSLQDTTRQLGDADTQLLTSGQRIEENVAISGYFEDYRVYLPYQDQIGAWFPTVPSQANGRDLVFHLRLGDRLFYHESYVRPVTERIESYQRAIESFAFDQLHIVTDLQCWKAVTAADLRKMKFHVGGFGGEQIIGTEIGIASIDQAVDYVNQLVEAFATYSPGVRCRQSVAGDFNFIRSFNQILFEHSTLAWWAAFLSRAERVGVYGPWRPSKGKKNKNLSQVSLPAWFQWA